MFEVSPLMFRYASRCPYGSFDVPTLSRGLSRALFGTPSPFHLTGMSGGGGLSWVVRFNAWPSDKLCTRRGNIGHMWDLNGLEPSSYDQPRPWDRALCRAFKGGGIQEHVVRSTKIHKNTAVQGHHYAHTSTQVAQPRSCIWWGGRTCTTQS